jgi:hypothetical protein
MIWTNDFVAERFRDAVILMAKQPKHQNGYPFAQEDKAIVSEVLQWVEWVSVSECRLIWMQAERQSWKQICLSFRLSRSGAWRYWQQALSKITQRLNQQEAEQYDGDGKY